MEVKIWDDKIVEVKKRKIIIPQGFILGNEIEVAFMKSGLSYFNIYPLEKILEFINILEERKKTLPIEEYQNIRRLIRMTYASIIDTYKLDENRRLLLPSQIKDVITEEKVLLQGINMHISLCPNQESYDELCQEYMPEKLGIQKF